MRIFLRLATFSFFLLCSWGASAEEFYFSASGGGMLLPKMTLRVVDLQDPSVDQFIDLDHKEGLGASAGMGFIFDNIRLGLEADYAQAEIKGGTGGEKEETQRLALGLVLMGDFLPSAPGDAFFYIPYAGVGLGYQWLEVNDAYRDRIGLNDSTLTENGFVKVMGGARLPLWRVCGGLGDGAECVFGASLDVRYEMIYFRQRDLDLPQDLEEGKIGHGVRMGLSVDF